jgi:hypothetical protein
MLSLMGFETFKRQRMPVLADPAVTIQKRGNLSLNAPAYEALGSPKAVELLYDRERRLIALRATEPGTESAYVVRPLSGNARVTSWLVAGMAFTMYYGIPTEVARRWVCRIEDGMLVLDLNEPSQEVSSNRDRQRKPALPSANGAAASQPGPAPNGSSTADAQASPIPPVRTGGGGDVS